MAMITGCKPEIISAEGDEIRLRIPGGVEGMTSFLEAIRVANLSDAEFRAEYGKKHGITTGGASFQDD